LLNRQESFELSDLQALPKVLLHEHLDCSLRPATILELWAEQDFVNAPKDIPPSAIKAFMTKSSHNSLLKDTSLASISQQYQQHLSYCASTSLASYLQAISTHVLPLMQSRNNLTRIARERIEDAVADGIVAMELRFAPQLHTIDGLSLREVMDAVIAGIIDAPIPVKLAICALRHEQKELFDVLAQLAYEYRDFVSLVDLAGDEKKYPGVLNTWLESFFNLREYGIDLTVHLWETNEPQNDDLIRLDQYQIKRIGHGIRGSRQNGYILEICPTSNVVTGQFASFIDHPVDLLYRQGKNVTINTDGTLFTCTDLSVEYAKLANYFGWSFADFYKVNVTALEASSFSSRTKAQVLSKLNSQYESKQISLT
jgi:adenosine deaminase